MDGARNVPPRNIPHRPMLILPVPANPETFDAVEDLARRVHELRAKRGLQVVGCVAGYDDFDAFPALNIYVADRDGGSPQWLGAAAVQGLSAADFLAVLRGTRPQAGSKTGRAA